jgi:hypothetical protein
MTVGIPFVCDGPARIDVSRSNEQRIAACADNCAGAVDRQRQIHSGRSTGSRYDGVWVLMPIDGGEPVPPARTQPEAPSRIEQSPPMTSGNRFTPSSGIHRAASETE